MNLNKLNKLNQLMLQKERSYEITLVDFIVTYDRLFKKYQELYGSYQEQAILLTKQEVNNEIGNWTPYEVTAYSQESGVITSIGIDLKANYTKYLSIAAVDPKIVPYGSTLLIEFADGTVKPYIAADTGGKIKGNRIDIYMTDRQEALQFGRQNLLVKIIK